MIAIYMYYGTQQQTCGVIRMIRNDLYNILNNKAKK
jgi:hypothetical protein